MGSREDLPRISVDRIDDWRRLTLNCKQAGQGLLGKELLTTQSDEREALLVHMHQFLDQTFHVAQPNLRINGHNYETLNKDGHDMETFDEALDRRIWSLADTRLQWQKRIAENRRNVPGEISNTHSRLLEEQNTIGSTLELPGDHETLNHLTEIDEQFLSGRVTEGIMKTLALAAELDQTINKQRERGERIREVTAEIKGLRS